MIRTGDKSVPGFRPRASVPMSGDVSHAARLRRRLPRRPTVDGAQGHGGEAGRGQVPDDTGRHRRSAAGLMVVLVLVTAACAGLMIARSQADRRETIEQRFDARQSSAARFIEAYVAQVLRHERRLATQALAGDLAPGQLEAITAQQQFQASVLLDSAGRLIDVAPSDPSLIGTPMGPRYTHLRLALTGVPTVSDVVPSAARADPVIGFAIPFDAPDGRRVFSGAYAIADTPLQPFITGALTSFRTGRVYLVDSTAKLIATDRTQQIGLPLRQVDAQLADHLSAAGGSGSPASGFLEAQSNTAEGDDGGGVQRYVVGGAVEGTPWRLVLVLDTSELYRSLTVSQTWMPWVRCCCSRSWRWPWSVW